MFKLNGRNEKHIYDDNNFGPTFGGGYDIHISDRCNVSKCSTNFPFTYVDTTGKGNLTFNNEVEFMVSDIEVFGFKL